MPLSGNLLRQKQFHLVWGYEANHDALERFCELKCRQDDGQNMTKIIAHSAMVCLIGDGAFPDVESACHPVEQTFRHWAEASQLHWLKPVSHQGIRYYGPRATATVPDDRYLFGTMIMDTRWGHGARQ